VYAEPDEPVLGDVVELDVEITNATTASRTFRFPARRRRAVLRHRGAGEQLSAVEFAHYRLRALAVGSATLRLSVNFETTFGCADAPQPVFHPVRSPPYQDRRARRCTAGIRHARPTRTPTPRRETPPATVTGPPLRRLTPLRQRPASSLTLAVWFAPAAVSSHTTCLRCSEAHDRRFALSSTPNPDRWLGYRRRLLLRSVVLAPRA
jgi:hypothetical protein